MELRGQDKEIPMPIRSLGYSPPPLPESSPISRLSSPIFSTAGDTGNEASTLSPSQTLDHRPQQQLQSQGRDPDSEADPVPVSIAVVGATGAQIAGGSNSNTAPPPPQPTTSIRSTCSIRYRECLKNHAASIGGHVIDGCGEFMPSGEEGNPEALRCAACNCHRNFHRKEVEGEPQSGTNSYYYYNHPSNKNSINRSRGPPIQLHPSLPPPPLLQQQKFPLIPSISPSTVPMPAVTMAFVGSGAGATESSSEDLNVYQSNTGAPVPPPMPLELSKKRFRTKFTQNQKDKMLEFAEKLGWRIQKQDENEVQQFCSEIGVKRQVLKVDAQQQEFYEEERTVATIEVHSFLGLLHGR